MSDRALLALAKEAGLLVRWTDASGRQQSVRPDTLKAVLDALHLRADSAAAIVESREHLWSGRAGIPPLVVARCGERFRLPKCRHAEAVADGHRTALKRDRGAVFCAPVEAGYYRLECDSGVHRLAVVPPHCLRVRDIAPQRRLCGLSVQIYALRGSGGFGDFAVLGEFAREAGRMGYDAVMASPAHALFAAEPGRFTPYSPSTRLFLNPLFADAGLAGVAAQRDSTTNGLVDWALAGPAKYAQLRRAFERFRARRKPDEFESFCRKGGERLLAHALFEVLDARFRAQGIAGFRNWPGGFESPHAPGACAAARAGAAELEYQLFLQWLAARSAASAQRNARMTMQIGIVSDIAVGMDPQGSHAWSAPHELLGSLHAGAPPDIFNSRGQDWGLTTLSPHALYATGFEPFVETLRAGMRHAGGVRIDHAMALRRLWVIPAGAEPADGVYLRYPERELLSLLALESQLNRAIVIGEDLGTVPEGFREEIAAAGILGMQVLWFERDSGGRFVSPGKWRRGAVAMTTTHDLPTVAGWWSEYDIALRRRAHDLHGDETTLRAGRADDRKALWSALTRARCAQGAAPARDDARPAVDAALCFVARTRSVLAFAPLEDIAGERDQPNLPGTTDEHPNWRRRIKQKQVLRSGPLRARLRSFVRARGGFPGDAS